MRTQVSCLFAALFFLNMGASCVTPEEELYESLKSCPPLLLQQAKKIVKNPNVDLYWEGYEPHHIEQFCSSLMIYSRKKWPYPVKKQLVKKIAFLQNINTKFQHINIFYRNEYETCTGCTADDLKKLFSEENSNAVVLSEK